MHNFDNWDDVKTKLIELYQDKKHHSQLIQELTNCKRGSDESITEFYERLENLSCQIISSLKVDIKDKKSLSIKIEFVNEITLGRFIFHSNPKISQMLRWKNFDNLNSAYSAAIAEEKILKMTKDNKYCNHCHCRNLHFKIQKPAGIVKSQDIFWKNVFYGRKIMSSVKNKILEMKNKILTQMKPLKKSVHLKLQQYHNWKQSVLV